MSVSSLTKNAFSFILPLTFIEVSPLLSASMLLGSVIQRAFFYKDPCDPVTSNLLSFIGDVGVKSQEANMETGIYLTCGAIVLSSLLSLGPVPMIGVLAGIACSIIGEWVAEDFKKEGAKEFDLEKAYRTSRAHGFS